MTKKRQFRAVNVEWTDGYFTNDDDLNLYNPTDVVELLTEWDYWIIHEMGVSKALRDVVRKQEKQIEELKKDRDFWKYNCCSRDNLNSILQFELDLARKDGYETSDNFDKYIKGVQKNLEWNKQHLNGDTE